MVDLIVLGYFVVGLIAARICRSRFDTGSSPIPHKNNCYANPRFSGYRGYCDENCAERGLKSTIRNWNYVWIVALALVAWPIHALAWFVLTERLPRPGRKPDLRTRTDKLRIQNQRASAELDRIEQELKMV